MNSNFLKREKLDTLDIPTLLRIIELTNDRISIIKIHASFHNNKGEFSPTKIAAQEAALKEYAGYLEKLAETLKSMGK